MGTCLPKETKNEKQKETVSELTPEEKIITQCEAKHVFSKKNFKDLCKSIKSESSNGFLSSPQLKRALLDLDISLDDLTSPDSSTYHLLLKAKNDKNVYDMRKLTLICTFLGTGSKADKCNWLFRQFDTDASCDLDLEEFLVMTEEIFDVCVRVLPVLAVGEGVCSLTQGQYLEYSHKLMEGKEKVKEDLGNEFRNAGKVDLEGFGRLMDGKLGQMLSSTLVRELLRKQCE